MLKSTLLVVASATLVLSQRPFFAGSKPIGYPELTTVANELGNRFGEENGTTQRLPIEALGDRELVNRLSKLPIDKQPFWFINWQALEAQRKNPQTYPQRPSSFAGSPGSNSNSLTNSGNANSAGVASSSSNNAGNVLANKNGVETDVNLGSQTNSGSLISNRFSDDSVGTLHTNLNSAQGSISNANDGNKNTHSSDGKKSSGSDSNKSDQGWKQILHYHNPTKYPKQN